MPPEAPAWPGSPGGGLCSAPGPAPPAPGGGGDGQQRWGRRSVTGPPHGSWEDDEAFKTARWLLAWTWNVWAVAAWTAVASRRVGSGGLQSHPGPSQTLPGLLNPRDPRRPSPRAPSPPCLGSRRRPLLPVEQLIVFLGQTLSLLPTNRPVGIKTFLKGPVGDTGQQQR